MEWKVRNRLKTYLKNSAATGRRDLTNATVAFAREARHRSPRRARAEFRMRLVAELLAASMTDEDFRDVAEMAVSVAEGIHGVRVTL